MVASPPGVEKTNGFLKLEIVFFCFCNGFFGFKSRKPKIALKNDYILTKECSVNTLKYKYKFM